METCSSPPTVFVHDHDEEVLQLIRDFLEPLGFTVAEVLTGSTPDEEAKLAPKVARNAA
jgi:CheY-like chemotaxis protein